MKKENFRKRIIIFTLLCALVLGGVLASYAFFIGASNNNKQEALTVNTGNIALTFNDGSDSFQGSLNFGESATKTFTIENTGSLDAKVRINWDNLINTYLDGSLTYTLSYSDTENGEYANIITNKNVPRSDAPITEKLSNDIKMSPGIKYYCKLIITLNYLEDLDQTADLNAMLATNFVLEDRTNISTLMARGSLSYTGEFWSQAANIKTITFENKMNPKANAAYTYDISEEKNGTVKSYLVRDSTDSSKYNLYIQSNGRVYANEDSSYFFYNFTDLELINGLENLDTSNVTNMFSMFAVSNSLTALDLSNFNTSNVTDMRGMFDRCSNLKSVDVSSFDTSNVTDIGFMFYECNSLTTLDLSNFDTSNVIVMGNMFEGCSNLKTLDLSSFDTSNVTDIRAIFDDCSNLTTTITIRGTKFIHDYSMFINAATEAGAQITVNYTAESSSIVDKMIATKSSNSNVVKGSQVA